MGIYRGPGGTGDATNDAASEATLVSQLVTQAQTSEANAAASATAAQTAENNAETAETNAETAATNAATSATNAASSASSASSSASSASTSASTATTKASEAATSATNAANSASSASTSASTATTQATNASNSASAAATSATNASNSASAAATSATNAASSATSAAGSATTATTQASNASTSATNAASSATSAAGSATTATTQAGIATTKAGEAATSATNAANSATNAANSASSASTSATNAAASATSASTSASTATTQATNAAASASTATTQATNAASSATSAASSATSASASAAAASAVALGNEPVRHSVRPSLLLDFANTKTLDPRITFTRASTGTYYDGKTTVKAEENLFTYSEQFNNAIWATGASISANTSVAPDGNTTADTYTRTSTGEQRLRYTTTQANSTAYTVSVYAKAGTANFLRLRNVATFTTGTTDTAWFNLSTGAVATVGANVTATITSVGNSWYRCSITGTTVASIGASNLVDIASATSDAEVSSGTSGETIILWGAQLEQRSSATAYTATSTAPITNYIPALQSAASGVARFEHNPVTRESLGLEIEEQRTNLALYSQDYTNAYWTKTDAALTGLAIAPDGTLTASKLSPTATTAWHVIYSNATSSLSGSYTFSAYAKAGGYSKVTIGDSQSGGLGVVVDLSNGTIITAFGTTATSITSVGNGWYRISFTATMSAVARFSYTIMNPSYTSGSFTGTWAATDAFSGIYIWGAQLEAGSFATSYIPTVASQVTRSADSASMTGTNFSSWYRADEGTMYAELANITLQTTTVQRWLSINNNTSSNRILVAYPASTSNIGFIMANNGTATVSSSAAGSTTPKIAVAFANNNYAASINAGSVVADTSCIVPDVTQLQFGAESTTSSTVTFKKVAYYPKRLTNAELQGLTTV